jgi:hypothetical protein
VLAAFVGRWYCVAARWQPEERACLAVGGDLDPIDRVAYGGSGLTQVASTSPTPSRRTDLVD